MRHRPMLVRAALASSLLALALPIGTPRAMPVAEFEALMGALREGDFATVEAFLARSENASQADPDFYVVLLNHAFRTAKQGGLVMARGEPGAGDYALKDRQTGEVVGFMGTREAWDEQPVVDAIARTRAAQPGFRDRLDIHYGIVAVAERVGRWDLVADQLVSMLAISREIDNAWVWGPVGSMHGEPEEFMLQNVLPRTSAMFRAETEEADRALVRVSQALVEHYPQRVYGHANLGVLALVEERYGDARAHLERARALDPEDPVVRGNLDKLAELESAGPAAGD